MFTLEPKISKLARWINTSELAKNNQFWCFSFSAAIGFSKELNNSVLNEGCCFVGGFLVGWYFLDMTFLFHKVEYLISMKWDLHLQSFSCRLQDTVMMQKYIFKQKNCNVVLLKYCK